jgi:hypothetical protein
VLQIVSERHLQFPTFVKTEYARRPKVSTRQAGVAECSLPGSISTASVSFGRIYFYR